MKKINTLVVVFIFLLSCDQQNVAKKEIENPAVITQSVLSEMKRAKPTESLSSTGDTLFFKLKMDSLNKHLIIPVLVSSGKELFATVSSTDKNANIRISQIGFPDSTFDGPFGKNLQYKIKTLGNYKIIIGENMMAGDPWKGDFILKIWVK